MIGNGNSAIKFRIIVTIQYTDSGTPDASNKNFNFSAASTTSSTTNPKMKLKNKTEQTITTTSTLAQVIPLDCGAIISLI
jgi:hypothetical protein